MREHVHTAGRTKVTEVLLVSVLDIHRHMATFDLCHVGGEGKVRFPANIMITAVTLLFFTWQGAEAD